MFFGKLTLPLSDLHQLTLPSNYREAMVKNIYLTQGFDRNLLLLPQAAFEAMYSHIKETSISDPLARLMSRLFLGGASEIAVDDSGRIELPGNLCEYAAIKNEIILVGQGEYSEIWSPVLWQNQIDSLSDFDANSNRFEKFHVSLS
jgi:MraZ protein